MVFRFARTSASADVHGRRVSRLAFTRSPFRRSEFLGLAFAVAAFLIAVLIRSALVSGQGEYPFLTFYPAVILTAYFAGTKPAILCTAVSTLALWYIGLPPFDSFALEPVALIALALYVIVCGVIIYALDALTHTAIRLENEQQRSLSLIEQQRTMFAELQHRVANNLAFISGLLIHQKKQIVADPSVASHLIDDTVRRLDMMGRLHRRLHNPEIVRQPLPEYLKELCSDLLDATGAQKIVCLIDADDIQLDLTKLTALSLLVCELLINSLKHAFKGRDGGTISINLKRLPGGGVALKVSDDGPGLPVGYDVATKAGLGLKIIKGLAAQLGGNITMPRAGTAATEVIFSA